MFPSLQLLVLPLGYLDDHMLNTDYLFYYVVLYCSLSQLIFSEDTYLTSSITQLQVDWQLSDILLNVYFAKSND